MNNRELEVNNTGPTKEKFLEDVRPILDEALEKRVGVNSVELSLATGELEGSEDLKVYFYEDGAPSYSLIELNPHYLSVNTFDTQVRNWDYVCVSESRPAGRFLIDQLRRVPNEADWRLVLKKTKRALDAAVSSKSKEQNSQATGEAKREAGDQDFIRQYDALFKETYVEPLRYPSVLYPGFEYSAVAAGDSSGAWFEMQNFYKKEGDEGAQKPRMRLLTIEDPKTDIVHWTIAIYESPFEIKWFRHKEKQSETSLSSEEKEWAISAVKEILKASRQF